MTTVTEHLYIVTNDDILKGEPIIKGTRTPVRAIVEVWRLGVIERQLISKSRPSSFPWRRVSANPWPSARVLAESV